LVKVGIILLFSGEKDLLVRGKPVYPVGTVPLWQIMLRHG